MNKYKHVFFDFNGTIINDVSLCLDLLNEALKRQNKEELDLNEYKNVFGFPIIDYYIKAGLDFNIESFDSIAKWFITKYQPKSMKCGLYDGFIDVIMKLKELGYKTYILSASEKNNLIEQCNHYDITKYFDDILGIDNIYAESKVNIAKNYFLKHNINPKEALFIGDTLHDVDVAREVMCDSLLVSFGHQSKEVLKSANVKIIDSYSELLEVL